MKHLLNYLTCAAVVLFAVACDPKDPTIPVEETLSAPTLTANPTSVEITEFDDNTIVSFAWTKASETLTVKYAFQITASTDTEFTSGVSIDCGEELSKTYTPNQITALMTELGIEGESFSLIARIRATAEGVDAVNSAIVTVAVSINLPVYIPATLYIVGNATEFGWSRDKEGQQLTPGQDEGIFTWEGNLYTTEDDANNGFKFTELNDGEWIPCYVRDAEATEYWTLRLNSSLDYNEPDIKFSVEEDGYYELTLNVVDLTIVATRTGDLDIDEPEYLADQIYPIGGAFPWGWSQDSAEAMTKLDNTHFRWIGHLIGGENFKFLCQNDGNWAPSFNRDANAEEYWSLIYCATGSPDDQFQVEADGEYVIEIDIDAITISVSLVADATIYPIGGAFSWGWSQDNAEMMTASGEPGIFEWTGTMTGGEGFKFLCQNNGNWVPGYNRDATAEEYWTVTYRGLDSQPDEQFSVEADGTYKLTLDVINMTLSAVLQ